MKIGFLLIAIGWPAGLAAQDFGVVATSPSPGDSSVALQTTVRFTFSSPLDTTARFAGPWPVEFFAIDPPDAISIDSVHFSEDLTVISFDVTHQDSTDFTWVMTGARSADSTLACPFVLTYSTADSLGRYSVSGWAASVFLVKSSTCYSILVGLRNAPYDKPGYLVAAEASDFIYGDGYEIRHVRPGTYWPVAYFDQNRNGIIEPNWNIAPDPYGEATHLGLSGGSMIDSVVVTDQSLANVDLLLIGGATESDSPSSFVTRMSTYPNPFATNFSLAFETVRAGEVKVSLSDILGRTIDVISERFLTGGAHEMSVSIPSWLPPGAYLVRVTAGPSVRSLMVVHIR